VLAGAINPDQMRRRGGELLVLYGAETFLRRLHPDLLLSVHPWALPSYEHSKGEVEKYLHGLNYEIHCLAVDHEETLVVSMEGIIWSSIRENWSLRSGRKLDE